MSWPQTLVVLEPATGEPLAEIALPSSAQVMDAVERAKKAQGEWALRSLPERSEIVRRWQMALVEDAPRLTELLVRENGKPRQEAQASELFLLDAALRWLTGLLPDSLSARTLDLTWQKHRRAEVFPRPFAVTAIISPFNFPLLIPCLEAAQALLAGSAVIIKPNPHTPLAVQRAAELAWREGLAMDLLQVLPGGPEVGRHLIDCGVSQVRFTGSTPNGRQVALQCAERLIPATLELGGNAPLVVLDDASIDRVAQATLLGALHNLGQSCFAVGRIYVPEPLVEPFAETLTSLMRPLRQGDPFRDVVDLGALTTASQLDRCDNWVRSASAEGARVWIGGARTDKKGNFYPPTLLTGVPPEAPLVEEEVFGPVVPVVSYRSLDSALSWIEKGGFGLAAYVFGEDLDRARQVAQSLNVAHALVDDVLSSYGSPELPLAPQRQSGLGVTHGYEGLLSHTRPFVLGLPRVSLPASIQFDWLRATAPHHKALRWFARGLSQIYGFRHLKKAPHR